MHATSQTELPQLQISDCIEQTVSIIPVCHISQLFPVTIFKHPYAICCCPQLLTWDLYVQT